MVAQAVRPLRLHLSLEPGRTIVGPGGVLLTRVLYVKENRGKTFVVVDSAMNDLMRPALYDPIHPITRVARGTASAAARRVDVVGPVCETGDCFLRDWPLGEVKTGDVLAIWSAGAYGMSQTSNYNARCRPVEVLVAGKRFRIIRRRETRQDLLRMQGFLLFLNLNSHDCSRPLPTSACCAEFRNRIFARAESGAGVPPRGACAPRRRLAWGFPSVRRESERRIPCRRTNALRPSWSRVRRLAGPTTCAGRWA